jgi:hypothetical protein
VCEELIEAICFWLRPLSGSAFGGMNDPIGLLLFGESEFRHLFDHASNRFAGDNFALLAETIAGRPLAILTLIMLLYHYDIFIFQQSKS